MSCSHCSFDRNRWIVIKQQQTIHTTTTTTTIPIRRHLGAVIRQSIGFVESSIMSTVPAPVDREQDNSTRLTTATGSGQSTRAASTNNSFSAGIYSPPSTSHSGLTPRKHDPTRDSIIANSSKGWSPLQPKRPQSTHPASRATSPTHPSNYTHLNSTLDDEQNMAGVMHGGPRRTSSSFKHVTGNALVSKSPFKSGAVTTDGRSSMFASSTSSTLHVRSKSTGTTTSMTSSASASASSSVTTPRKSSNLLSGIGLGISASSPRRSSGRKSSGSKSRSSSGSGARKVSAERMKTPPSDRRRVSGEERRASGGALRSIDDPMNNEMPEYDDLGQYSPDVRASSGRMPRQSMGFKGLAKGGLVSRSPFLQQAGTMGAEADEGSTPLKRNVGTASPARAGGLGAKFDSPRQPAQEDVFSSPPISTQDGSGRRISPIYRDRVGAGSTNDSPSKRRPSQQGSAESLVPFPSSSSSQENSSSLRAEKPLPPIQQHYEPSNTATRRNRPRRSLSRRYPTSRNSRPRA
jgi:serine/arginine repetitive matrix protein 2